MKNFHSFMSVAKMILVAITFFIVSCVKEICPPDVIINFSDSSKTNVTVNQIDSSQNTVRATVNGGDNNTNVKGNNGGENGSEPQVIIQHDTIFMGEFDYWELRTLYSALYETGAKLEWTGARDLIPQTRQYEHHNITRSPLRYIIICGAIGSNNFLSDEQVVTFDYEDNSLVFSEAQSIFKKAQRVNEELFDQYGIKEGNLQAIIQESEYLRKLQKEYPNESLLFYILAVEEASHDLKFGI